MSRRLLLILTAFIMACSARIQHGLDERQANEIQTALVEHGIEAQKVLEPGKKPTWEVEVDEDHATDAVRVLAELGLPRPKTEGFAEVFGKGSLVPSAMEEQALYVEALSGEVARTLESADGVVSARVHLVLPPANHSTLNPVPAKAAAFLRVRPEARTRLETERGELKSLIAASVPGLGPDGVTILIDPVVSSVELSKGHPDHRGRLRLAVAFLGVLTVILGGVLIALTLRLRLYRRELTMVRSQLAPRGTTSNARRAA